MAASKRLFIAIELPAAAKNRLRTVHIPLPGVRWLRSEQLHLTLAFVGTLAGARQPALEAALAHVQAGSFLLSLEGRGRFPKRGPARVLWVAAHAKPASALPELHRKICEQLTQADLPYDHKPLRPHVTVARVRRTNDRQGRDALQPFLQQTLRVVEPFAVTAFALISSRLLPEGARYTQEARFELE